MTESSSVDLKAVASNFNIHGDFVEGAPYGSGHIHDTFAIVMNQSGMRIRYIMQRINTVVFQKPEVVQSNIKKVADHLGRKMAGRPDASRRRLELVPTREGSNHYIDPDGSYWRMYLFIEGATTHDQIETAEQSYQAARAFGTFVMELSDIPVEIEETIPDFHNTPARFSRLQEAIEADEYNRAANVQPEIDFALAQEPIVSTLVDLHKEGRIPERVTHNDTKLNNVMLDDETNEGVCVIDLDTCMPGLSLYDFGDMVRTAARPTTEDEQNLDKVVADIDMFKALAKGYYETLGDVMMPEEKDNMAFSAKLITFEIGIRFLTDYLQGDIYFKTKREGHNIDRCRTQFKMTREFDQHMKEMEEFINSL